MKIIGHGAILSCCIRPVEHGKVAMNGLGCCIVGIGRKLWRGVIAKPFGPAVHPDDRHERFNLLPWVYMHSLVLGAALGWLYGLVRGVLGGCALPEVAEAAIQLIAVDVVHVLPARGRCAHKASRGQAEHIPMQQHADILAFAPSNGRAGMGIALWIQSPFEPGYMLSLIVVHNRHKGGI